MKLPNFHDGFFDGFILTGEKAAHLFLRTAQENRFTLALGGIEAMIISNVKSGNIILDVVIEEASAISADRLANVYELAANGKSEQIQRLLASARRDSLSLLEMSSSYGAEGAILFKSQQLIEGVRVS